ncbi:hypothetical protein U1Q18_017843 [Sarracenia purpurea var. burkii]
MEDGLSTIERSTSIEREDGEDIENFPEEGDSEVWGIFVVNFRQVQSILDRNRVLIHDNLVKNVALIQEINAKISKVASLYADLSANFSSKFHQGNPAVDAKSNNAKGDSAHASS